MFADSGTKLSPNTSGVRDNRLFKNGRCPGGDCNAENKDCCLESGGEPNEFAGSGFADGVAGLVGFVVAAGGAGVSPDGAGFAAGVPGAG